MSDDPFGIFMGEDADDINSETLTGDVDDESDHPDVAASDDTTAPADNKPDNNSKQNQYINDDVYTHFLQPKGKMLLLSVQSALDIGKFRIGIGEKNQGDDKMQFVNAYADALRFASWMETVRNLSVRTLNGGDDDAMKFAQYGGSVTSDGTAMSRIFSVGPASDKDGNLAKGRYTLSIRLAQGKRADNGAIIPTSEGEVYGSQNFTLSGTDFANMALRCYLALQTYMFQNGLGILGQ